MRLIDLKRGAVLLPLAVAMFGWHAIAYADAHGANAEEEQSVAEYSEETRDEAVDSARSALERADARIDRMQEWMYENWQDMDEAARENARKTMDALREQRTRAAEWFGSLRHSSAETWEETKQGFAGAYDSLQDAWERARASLTDDEDDQPEQGQDAEQ